MTRASFAASHLVPGMAEKASSHSRKTRASLAEEGRILVSEKKRGRSEHQNKEYLA